MQISHCLVTFPAFDPRPMQTSHFRFTNGSDFARLMQFRLSMDSGPRWIRPRIQPEEKTERKELA
jgi:hypothetical protein